MEKVASLFRPQPTDDIYPNDRLPSEQIVPTFALRGFRGSPPKYAGEPVMIAASPYFKAEPLDAFIQWHGAEMLRTKRIARELVIKDLQRLEDVAHSSDAVLVVPSW